MNEKRLLKKNEIEGFQKWMKTDPKFNSKYTSYAEQYAVEELGKLSSPMGSLSSTAYCSAIRKTLKDW